MEAPKHLHKQLADTQKEYAWYKKWRPSYADVLANRVSNLEADIRWFEVQNFESS